MSRRTLNQSQDDYSTTTCRIFGATPRQSELNKEVAKQLGISQREAASIGFHLVSETVTPVRRPALPQYPTVLQILDDFLEDVGW